MASYYRPSYIRKYVVTFKNKIISELTNTQDEIYDLKYPNGSLGDVYSDRTILDFNTGSSLKTDGSLMNDADWNTSDFIPVNKKLVIRGYGYSTDRVVIALYNENKEFTTCYKGEILYQGNFYYKEMTILPTECSFVRLVGSKKYNLITSVKYFLSLQETILKHDKQLENINGFKPYSKDTIFFNVMVNQNFADNTCITTDIQDSEVFKPVSCALRLPTVYSIKGKPTKIAVVMHGAGGQVTSLSGGEMNGFTDLLNNGYAIFDVNGSNDDYSNYSDHMGSSRTLSAYLKAYDWIKANYNVEHKLYVHGHSMGGLTALNFAIQNPSICKVLGLYHPVVDMYNQAWVKPWFGGSQGTRFAIAREYNFDDKTGNTYEKDKVIGFNPIENNSIVVDNKRYNNFPCSIKIWHGNSDTTVSLSGSQNLIEAFKNAGVRCELRVLDGVAHEHTGAMYKELTLWFNRF